MHQAAAAVRTRYPRCCGGHPAILAFTGYPVGRAPVVDVGGQRRPVHRVDPGLAGLEAVLQRRRGDTGGGGGGGGGTARGAVPRVHVQRVVLGLGHDGARVRAVKSAQQSGGGPEAGQSDHDVAAVNSRA